MQFSKWKIDAVPRNCSGSMCSPQHWISNERLIVTWKMLPKIGLCICFALCWILLYCSWRISEITSAVPRKPVMRNSLTYTRSLWRTLCPKRSPRASTWRQRDGALVTALPGGGKHDRIFPESYAQNPSIWDRWCGPGTLGHTLCKAPAEVSWLPGTPTPPALQPLPSSQPTTSWLSNTSARCVPPCVPCSSTAPSHTILVFT